VTGGDSSIITTSKPFLLLPLLLLLLPPPPPQVRPGGLSTDPPKGVSALEINQGDFIIGEVSRADVAAACVEVLNYDDTKDVTFEIFETGRR